MQPLLALASIGAWSEAQLLSNLPMSASERARLAGFAHPRRRQSFIAGRTLARQLVAQVLGTEGFELDIDAQGRSSVAHHPGLHLSISHTAEWAACAVDASPIGLDLEDSSRPRGDVLALAATVHSPAQCDALAGLHGEAQLRRFYQLWTLKEAALKREGQGLDFARMRAMAFEADAEQAANALSLEHAEQGLVMALVGGPFLEAKTPALPAGVCVIERLTLSDQSTPKSK